MPSSRPKADWVYRTNVRDEEGGILETMGSYTDTASFLVAGPGGLAKVLYDSHNYAQNALLNFTGTTRALSASARTEAARPKVIAVQGQLDIVPSTWALGSLIRIGVRMGIYEQDASVGALLIDPSYSMWIDPANPQFSAAMWANDRAWAAERRLSISFNPDRARFSILFKWVRVNRKLAPNMCYALFIESASDSVAINVRPWFRTLVADDS